MCSIQGIEFLVTAGRNSFFFLSFVLLPALESEYYSTFLWSWMWSLKNINLRGTGSGFRFPFPNGIVSMDIGTDATNKQCDRRAGYTLRVGTTEVLIRGFGERDDPGWWSL